MSVFYEEILQSFVQRRPRAHTPRFRVAPDPVGWRLFDGETAIGLVLNRGWVAFDLWSFSPFARPVMVNQRPLGKVIDLHTMHNTVLNLPGISAPELCQGVNDPFGRLQMTWRANRGAQLDLEFRGELADQQRYVYHFRVRYDRQWARYRYFVDADFWKLTYEGLEPINMMMASALVSRPERMRWTHSVWEDPNGQLKRLVHSNALFSATDYASHGNGEWRSKNGPRHGAWIAYAANDRFNPAMLIHETSAPVHFATCSQLFDEHLIWDKAGLDQLDEGFFHFVMRTELVDLAPRLARAYLNRAADPPRPKHWRHHQIALPFRLDQVNTFDQPLDPWAPEDCTILVVDPASANTPAGWDTKVGRRGHHSLRLTGRDYRWTHLCPIGAVCDVEPHTRYKFRAWVKTKDVSRFARLDLLAYEYNYATVIHTAQSAHVAGTRDWTLLEAELDTGDEAYVMPRFALYGAGAAWFTEAQLVKA